MSYIARDIIIILDYICEYVGKRSKLLQYLNQRLLTGGNTAHTYHNDEPVGLSNNFTIINE